MTNLLAILLVFIIAFVFWQQRRQAEIARQAVKRKCQQLNLQLVSVAFAAHKIKTPAGRWRWHTLYHFEFSSLGDDCYQGELIMRGFQVVDFNLPAYRFICDDE